MKVCSGKLMQHVPRMGVRCSIILRSGSISVDIACMHEEVKSIDR